MVILRLVNVRFVCVCIYIYIYIYIYAYIYIHIYIYIQCAISRGLHQQLPHNWVRSDGVPVVVIWHKYPLKPFETLPFILQAAVRKLGGNNPNLPMHTNRIHVCGRAGMNLPLRRG